MLYHYLLDGQGLDQNIRADVIKVLAKDYLKKNKGISMNYPYKK